MNRRVAMDVDRMMLTKRRASTLLASLLMAVLSMMVAVPTQAQRRACENNELTTLARYATEVQDYQTGQQPPELPSLLNECDPDGLLDVPLGQPLGRWIAEAAQQKNYFVLRYQGKVLAKIREAYSNAEHPGDFRSLSEIIVSQLTEVQLAGLPRELPAEPASATKEQLAEARLKSLDDLIKFLEEVKAPLSRASVLQGPKLHTPSHQNSQTQSNDNPAQKPSGPKTDTDRSSSPSNWPIILTLGLGLGILLILLIVFLLKGNNSGIVDGLTMKKHSSGSPEATSARDMSSHRSDPPLRVDRSDNDRRSPEELAAEPSPGQEQALGTVGEDSPVEPSREDTSTTGDRQVPTLGTLNQRLERQYRVMQSLGKNLDKVTERLIGLENQLAQYQLPQMSEDLQTVQEQSGTLHKSIEQLEGSVQSSEQKLTEVEGKIAEIPTPLAAEMATEQLLLQDDWSRFYNTHREIVDLAKSFDVEEGKYKIIFKDLLNDVPQAVASMPKLSQAFAAKLAKVRIYNRQLKQLGRVEKLAHMELPEEEIRQRQQLLLLREGVQLLGIMRHTDLGDQILSFKPVKWCAEELPELADRFFRQYQVALAEGRADPLENAHEIMVKALKVGNLKPIKIILGETPFDSELHIGRSRVSDVQHPNGTIVQVVKNGFRSLLDNRVVAQPEVIVNRI